jgi:hypothetical protein
MRRVSSQGFHQYILLRSLALLLLTSLAAYGQSLGDVARENREKKAAAPSSAPPKVITNADLPKDPDGDAGPSAGEVQTTPSPASAESSRKAAEQRAAEHRAAERWKKRILAQENTIVNLQTRVDNLKASIYFADPNVHYDAMVYNRYQARQLQRLTQMQRQLDQQKKELEDMQEAARHAGMHTAVYDP